LWAAAIFVTAQLAASGLLDYWWPQVRFPTLHQQLARFDATDGAVNIVFLGSSRTGCLMAEAELNRVTREITGDPQVNCFNAYVPAGDPILCERMLRRLFERPSRPRFVVIEVCPEGLNQRTAWLAMYVGWALCWNDVPAYIKDLAVTGSLVRFCGTRFIPLYVYRDQIRRQLAACTAKWCLGSEYGLSPVMLSLPQGMPPPASQPNPHGNIAQGPGVKGPGSESGRYEVRGAAEWWKAAIASSLRETRIDPNRTTTLGLEGVRRELKGYRTGGNAAGALEQMLRQCRAHGVEPILMSVPLSSGHRQCYDPEVEAAFQACMAEMTRKYACRYVDYRDALPDHFFVDHHHAAPEGACLFSRQIAVELLAPAWTGEW
jgi:hypothetical protein